MPLRLIILALTLALTSASLAHANGDHRADPRANCQLALKAPGEKDDVQTAKKAVAELLLMMIFEHPTLLEAAEHRLMTDRQAWTLFHFSAGFGIKPKTRRSWRGRDLSHYNDFVEIERARKNLWGLNPKPDSHNNLQRNLSDMLRPGYVVAENPRSVLNPYITELLSTILHQIANMTGLNARDNFNEYGAITYESQLLRPRTQDQEGPIVRVTNFRGLSPAQLDVFRALREPIANSDGKLAFRDAQTWVYAYWKQRLHKILEVREQIISQALKGSGGIREALLHPSTARLSLRKEILELAQGEGFEQLAAHYDAGPSQPPVLTLFKEEETIEERHQELRGREERFADWSERLDQRRTSDGDTLNFARKALSLVDEGVDLLPLPEELSKAMRSVRTEIALDQNGATLLRDLSEAGRTASEDAEFLERLRARVEPLIVLTLDQLKGLSAELESSGATASKASAKLEQAELLRASLIDTLVVFESRTQRYGTWMDLLGRLENLTRQYRNQRALGDDAAELAVKVVEILRSMAPEPH